VLENVAKSNYLAEMMDNHQNKMANFEASKNKDKEELTVHITTDRLALGADNSMDDDEEDKTELLPEYRVVLRDCFGSPLGASGSQGMIYNG
jgi:hypothetical protein